MARQVTPTPLKINAELALYRARTAAYEARRCVPRAGAQRRPKLTALCCSAPQRHRPQAA